MAAIRQAHVGTSWHRGTRKTIITALAGLYQIMITFALKYKYTVSRDILIK